MTYKDFIDEQVLNFEIDWEERREYINEMMYLDNIARCIKYLEPLKEEF